MGDDSIDFVQCSSGIFYVDSGMHIHLSMGGYSLLSHMIHSRNVTLFAVWKRIDRLTRNKLRELAKSQNGDKQFPRTLEMTVLFKNVEGGCDRFRLSISSTPGDAKVYFGQFVYANDSLIRSQIHDLVMESENIYVFLKSSDRRFIYASPSMCRALGKTPATIRNLRDDDIIIDEKEVADFRKDDLNVLDGQSLQLREEKITFRASDVRFVATYKKQVIAPDGSAQIFGIATDITSIRTNAWRTNYLLEIVTVLARELSGTETLKKVYSKASNCLRNKGFRDCAIIVVEQTPHGPRFNGMAEYSSSTLWQKVLLNISRQDILVDGNSSIERCLTDLLRGETVRMVEVNKLTEATPDDDMCICLSLGHAGGDDALQSFLFVIDLSENNLLDWFYQDEVRVLANDHQLLNWGVNVAETLRSSLERIAYNLRAIENQNQLVAHAKLVSFETAAVTIIHALEKRITEHKKRTRKMKRDDRSSQNLDFWEYIDETDRLLEYWHLSVKKTLREFRAADEQGPVSPLKIANDVIRSLDTKSQTMGCKMNIEFTTGDTEHFVWGSAQSIFEIVTVLVDNALEASSRTVSISCSTSTVASVMYNKRFVDLWVVDDGVGIVLDDYANVKKPGFTSKKRGNGLGLAIADILAAHMGGSLELYSGGKAAGEEETRWVVRLPLHK